MSLVISGAAPLLRLLALCSASSMRQCCSGAYSMQGHSDSDPLVPAACDDAAAVPTARSGTPTVIH